MRREIVVPLVLLAILALLLTGCATCSPGAGVSKDTDGVGALQLYIECDL